MECLQILKKMQFLIVYYNRDLFNHYTTHQISLPTTYYNWDIIIDIGKISLSHLASPSSPPSLYVL